MPDALSFQTESLSNFPLLLYLSGHLVNIDEFKCGSFLSEQHSSLTSLVDALFASKQVIGCRINVSERMSE